MNHLAPVYTLENECQDCYKCVRRCHCKAIKIVNAKASVIPDACVACGECVRVCPAHAKVIRSDLARLRLMLDSGDTIYASIAPSFVGYFKGVSIGEIAHALMAIGFAGVSETAHGAEAVSSQSCAFLRQTESPLVISSACPACVDYIRKYWPKFTSYIEPVQSPILAHCRLLRDTYGENIKTVFFGPCAAKKNEADHNAGLLNLALTFDALAQLLEERHSPITTDTAELALGPAAEGRFYSIEGGMNDTIREGQKNVRFVSVSGLDNLSRMLSGADCMASEKTIFIEALACHGGCINGPVMPQDSATLDTIFATDRSAPLSTSDGKHTDTVIKGNYQPDKLPESEPTEEQIAKALARVGKYCKEDEINCGACGYNTCRDFARALLEDKAEEAMCHTYLRRNFERTSNALIKYIPAAVVIVDEELAITECNRNFATLTNQLDIYNALGNLNTIPIQEYLPEFAELFTSVIEHGGEIEKFHQKYKDQIINISVFSIAKGKFAGAVLQDVTQNEIQREQIAQKAREVIRKNVITVQEVARLFGEHIAETEIMLNEVAGTYESHSGVHNEQ